MKEFRKFVTFLSVGIACVLLLAAPALADPRKGHGEIGFGIGSTDFDSDVGSAGMRGDFRIGYHLARNFQLEAQLGYAGDKSSTGPNTRLTTGFVNGVFNFHPGGRSVPYFLLGAGGAQLDTAGFDDTGFAYQLAGGVRAFGTQGKIGLRVEVGWMWEDSEPFPVAAMNDTRTHLNITAGMTFVLGAHQPHTPQQLRPGVLQRRAW